MEQYGQLSSHGNHPSFLGIFPSSLGKLPAPAVGCSDHDSSCSKIDSDSHDAFILLCCVLLAKRAIPDRVSGPDCLLDR